MDQSDAQPSAVHLKDFEPVPPDILSIFPEGLIRKHMIVPLTMKEGHLIAAVPRTEGIVKPEGLKFFTGCPVDFVLAPIDEIIEFIKTHYAKEAPPPAPAPVAGAPQEPAPAVLPRTDVPPLSEMENPGLSSILLRLLSEAITQRASEIVMDREGETYRMRWRIRGVLVGPHPQKEGGQKECENLIDTVRGMSEPIVVSDMRWLEVKKEIRAPAGRFYTLFSLTETPMTTLLTIKLSPQVEKLFSPSAWGMDPPQAKLLEDFLASQQGLVLFCGTAEDDLTRTIHSCTRKLATSERHVLAVESEIEEGISGVPQFVSHGDAALFSKLLQTAFEHGPDVLVVSPLVGKDDIVFCLQKAARGPLVLGRSFARDTADALIQILNMGIEPYLLSSTLLGVVAQRKLRLNCPHCQDKESVTRERAKEIGIPAEIQPPYFYRGQGCDRCQGTGYDRETEIFEVLELTDDLKNAFVHGLNIETLRTTLRNKGIRTLRQIANHKAISGQTSLAEVVRVTPK
ncbi:MAG: Flp pilus assembly complex ATPase component TadA [Elusimicrobia bacterium]|nr:Flp pilus assembly complex ATPase component TadA [Candidatus Obscuribacterium magneticum]